MFRLLIFGGTTEGRQLAEYCAKKKIETDVSVTTDYGASLLPDGVNILCGKLDAAKMTELISRGYAAVVDATHPYAVEATENIRAACSASGTKYLRLIRKNSAARGNTVNDLSELARLLSNTPGNVLCTLGSKSLPALTAVKDFRERIWVRILPGDEALAHCRTLGYDEAKIIQEKGPFSVEQNLEHLKKCDASVIVTKESGDAGGYPEKAEAARIYGAELITLARPAEHGYSFEEIIKIIEKELEK